MWGVQVGWLCRSFDFLLGWIIYIYCTLHLWVGEHIFQCDLGTRSWRWVFWSWMNEGDGMKLWINAVFCVMKGGMVEVTYTYLKWDRVACMLVFELLFIYFSILNCCLLLHTCIICKLMQCQCLVLFWYIYIYIYKCVCFSLICCSMYVSF